MAIQTVVATLANNKELKPEQEQRVNVFIKGRHCFFFVTMWFGKRLMYQFAPLVAK